MAVYKALVTIHGSKWVECEGDSPEDAQRRLEADPDALNAEEISSFDITTFDVEEVCEV